MTPIIKVIPIDSIIINKRKRPLKDFEALKNSIREVGLLNPITIYKNCALVAGYHRLEACKALGWTQIPAVNIDNDNLKAEQAQIDENIIRNKLTALEMAEQLLRRKEIYEIKYPDSTKAAITSQNLKQFTEKPLSGLSVDSFIEDTAFKIGRSKTSIKDYVQIGRKISDEIKELIRGSLLEDRKTDLLKLSRIDDIDRQRELVEGIINGEATTISGLIRKEKLQKANGIHLPDMTKPMVPTSLFKRLYQQFIDLEIKYSQLELENKNLKEQTI
ncbi:MAG: ParB/RepB/Spo0J family partition protein [Vampirovibrionia bacterium]